MPSTTYNWICCSGGKDSTALLLWTIEEKLPNCRYIYADTKFEHPELYAYLEYLEDRLGVRIERIESEGFIELAKRKGRFPSSVARFCTEHLKIIPMARYIDQAEDHDGDNPHMLWVGIRREESTARSRMPETIYTKVNYPPRKVCHQLRNHPLLDWYTQDVFDIHRRFGIEPNPLYKMGMHRVGCFPCIMARHAELRTIFKRMPEMVDKIEAWEAEVQAAAKAQGKTKLASTLFSTADYKFPMAGIRDLAAYLSTGAELPGMEQDVQGCMSIYGLCE